MPRGQSFKPPVLQAPCVLQDPCVRISLPNVCFPFCLFFAHSILNMMTDNEIPDLTSLPSVSLIYSGSFPHGTALTSTYKWLLSGASEEGPGSRSVRKSSIARICRTMVPALTPFSLAGGLPRGDSAWFRIRLGVCGVGPESKEVAQVNLRGHDTLSTHNK